MDLAQIEVLDFCIVLLPCEDEDDMAACKDEETSCARAGTAPPVNQILQG